MKNWKFFQSMGDKCCQLSCDYCDNYFPCIVIILAFAKLKGLVYCSPNAIISLTHHYTIPHFDTLKIYSCGNIVRKGKIACNKQSLLF